MKSVTKIKQLKRSDMRAMSKWAVTVVDVNGTRVIHTMGMDREDAITNATKGQGLLIAISAVPCN